ncbi:hypothetical protein B0T21DRAFT_339706 [Apiosordaria backusii]|uniref:Uncharacterized protein n=1 Tax=Apiosordaria backusii TaxID=314023 RepID=A0AA40AJ06_9PEZI|nr:hypothetical protein B0T21DRAFT_339706 [Apiosordaria backusii]
MSYVAKEEEDDSYYDGTSVFLRRCKNHHEDPKLPVATDCLGPTIPEFAVQDAFPVPGYTYIIYDRATGYLLSLYRGKVTTRSHAELTPDCATWHWQCDDNNGWLGFVQESSGRYLGVGPGLTSIGDNMLTLVVDSKSLGPGEQFYYRKDGSGGYQLFFRSGEKMLSAMMDSGDNLRFDRDCDGMVVVWHFIRVD